MSLFPERPVTPPPFPESGGTPLRSSFEIAEERAAQMQEELDTERRLEDAEGEDELTAVAEEATVEEPVVAHDMDPTGYGHLVEGGTYIGHVNNPGEAPAAEQGPDADTPEAYGALVTGAGQPAPTAQPGAATTQVNDEDEAARRERAINSLAMDNMDVVQDTLMGQPAQAPATSGGGADQEKPSDQTIAAQDPVAAEIQKTNANEEQPFVGVTPGQEILRYESPEDKKEIAKEEQVFQEMTAPNSEKPLEERLKYAEDILDQLKANEKQRQDDRFRVRPFGPFKFLEGSLTAANKWLNGTDAGKITKVIGKLVLGGAAFVASAGAGPLVAPLLFSLGSKMYASGMVENVQQIFCGWKKNPETGKYEVSSSAKDRLKLQVMKEDFFAHAQAEVTKIREDHDKGLLTQDELIFSLHELTENLSTAERQIIDKENSVIKSEKSREKFRSVVSSGTTLALGLLGGVPLGTHDLDHDKVHHMVRWSMKGFGFNYQPGEIAGTMAKHAISNVPGASPLTTYNMFGGLSHALGGATPEMYAGLAAAGLGLATKIGFEWRKPRTIDSKPIEGRAQTWGGPGQEEGKEGEPKGPEVPPTPEAGKEKEGDTSKSVIQKAKDLAAKWMGKGGSIKENLEEPDTADDAIESIKAAAKPEDELKFAKEEVPSNPEQEEQFKNDFENWINTTAAKDGKAAESRQIKLALTMLGVKYHAENDQIRLDDVKELTIGMRDFKEVFGKKKKKTAEIAAKAPEAAPVAEAPEGQVAA